MGVGTFEDERVSAPVRTQDVLSDILGARSYVRFHRMSVRLRGNTGVSSKLQVSRFYFDTEPPTAVDFLGEVKRGKPEILAKYAYCEAHRIRYVLLANEWDTDGLQALFQALNPAAESATVAKVPADLLIAPRKPRGNT